MATICTYVRISIWNLKCSTGKELFTKAELGNTTEWYTIGKTPLTVKGTANTPFTLGLLWQEFMKYMLCLLRLRLSILSLVNVI